MLIAKARSLDYGTVPNRVCCGNRTQFVWMSVSMSVMGMWALPPDVLSFKNNPNLYNSLHPGLHLLKFCKLALYDPTSLFPLTRPFSEVCMISNSTKSPQLLRGSDWGNRLCLFRLRLKESYPLLQSEWESSLRSCPENNWKLYLSPMRRSIWPEPIINEKRCR